MNIEKADSPLTQRKSERTIKPPKLYDAEDGKWKDQVENEVHVVFIPAIRHQEPEVVHAKKLELENWKKMEVVDCVED